MADDPTQTLNSGTAEERIMARLDGMETRINDRFTGIESRLDNVEQRLSTLETKVEDRLRETRPIWEQALAEILNVGQEVKAMSAKLDVLADDVLVVRAKQREADARLRDLEAHLHRA